MSLRALTVEAQGTLHLQGNLFSIAIGRADAEVCSHIWLSLQYPNCWAG